MKNQKTFGIIFLIVIIACGIYYITNYKAGGRYNVIQNSEGINNSPLTQNIDNIFELNKKSKGTKIYYSDKLGIGFTYFPLIPDQSIKITESENKIIFNGQTIEVFTKNPKVTLGEAIKETVLNGYSTNNCYVRTYKIEGLEMDNYVAVEISLPVSNDTNEPFWQNSDKCPIKYSETNGIRYFLMNKDVPEKFIFIDIGQDAIASNGIPGTGKGLFGWNQSILILK